MMLKKIIPLLEKEGRREAPGWSFPPKRFAELTTPSAPRFTRRIHPSFSSRGMLIVVLFALFTTTAAAQSNWVDRFLNRYKPPKVDPAAAVTPQVSDEPWRLMVTQGGLPLSINDVVRLMLSSNLDVTVNRFSPLATRYLLETLFRPFEPTLDISAQVNRNNTPSTAQFHTGQCTAPF